MYVTFNCKQHITHIVLVRYQYRFGLNYKIFLRFSPAQSQKSAFITLLPLSVLPLLQKYSRTRSSLLVGFLGLFEFSKQLLDLEHFTTLSLDNYQT